MMNIAKEARSDAKRVKTSEKIGYHVMIDDAYWGYQKLSATQIFERLYDAHDDNITFVGSTGNGLAFSMER